MSSLYEVVTYTTIGIFCGWFALIRSSRKPHAKLTPVDEADLPIEARYEALDVLERKSDESLVLLSRLLTNPGEYCFVRTEIEDVRSGDRVEVQRQVLGSAFLSPTHARIVSSYAARIAKLLGIFLWL